MLPFEGDGLPGNFSVQLEVSDHGTRKGHPTNQQG